MNHDVLTGRSGPLLEFRLHQLERRVWRLEALIFTLVAANLGTIAAIVVEHFIK